MSRASDRDNYYGPSINFNLKIQSPVDSQLKLFLGAISSYQVRS